MPKASDCAYCHKPIALDEPHVRQALLDIEGKWKRPHYDSFHMHCHFAQATSSTVDAARANSSNA